MAIVEFLGQQEYLLVVAGGLFVAFQHPQDVAETVERVQFTAAVARVLGDLRGPLEKIGGLVILAQ